MYELTASLATRISTTRAGSESHSLDQLIRASLVPTGNCPRTRSATRRPDIDGDNAAEDTRTEKGRDKPRRKRDRGKQHFSAVMTGVTIRPVQRGGPQLFTSLSPNDLLGHVILIFLVVLITTPITFVVTVIGLARIMGRPVRWVLLRVVRNTGPPGQREFQDHLQGKESLHESLSCIIILRRDCIGCRLDDKFRVDMTDKDWEGVEGIDVNSKVIGGTGPRNLVLSHKGNAFHAHHGNEKVAEIFAIPVKFLSYSDSSRINMNSYLNFFLEKWWGRRPSIPSIAGRWRRRVKLAMH